MKDSCLLSCMKLSFVLFILYTNTKLGRALNSVDLSTCMITTNTSTTDSEFPSCTFHISESISAQEVSMKCIAPGVLQIQGDYKEFYINCTASYPIDFRFDGHTPTEAIHTDARATVKRHSHKKIESFHMNIKVFSIPSLREYYTLKYPKKIFHQQDAYNYSRTGNYIFSGYHTRRNQQSEIYIFFEEEWAVHSFIKNEHVKINLATEGHPLVVPCRPSHLNDIVTIDELTNTSAYDYDATVGFTLSETWKTFMLKNQTGFTCVLSYKENMKKAVEFFAMKPSNTKYGYDGLGEQTNLILTNIVNSKIGNREHFVRVHCQNKNHTITGSVSLSMQDIKNPTEYRFLRHFVFPMFSNGSYSTTVLNTTYFNGVANGDLTSTSFAFNALCMDSTSYEVNSYGVSIFGRLTPFDMGEEFASSNRAENYGVHQYFAISHNQPQHELYEGQLVTFQCKILNGLFIPPAIWYSVRKNGSIVEESITNDWEDYFIAHAKLRMSKDIKGIMCAACVWHTPAWKNFTMNITVSEPVKPTFDLKQNPVQKFHERSENQVLKCIANGKPLPDIWWQRNGKNISSKTTTTSKKRTCVVDFRVVRKEDEGEYVCFAANVAKVESRTFTVEVPDSTQSITIGVSVTICICFAIAISLVVYFRKYRTKEGGLTESEINEFLNGEGGADTAAKKSAKSNEYAHEISHLCPYNKEYEVPSSRFSIDTKKVLGSGTFGMVVMGELDGIPVAVKTVKGSADKMYLKALLSELKVMISLGVHENIVATLGSNTKDLCKGLAYIFVPFCSLGSMELYLRQNRNRFTSSNSNYTNVNFKKRKTQCAEDAIESNTSFITDTNLYEWSVQIAKGMAYLGTKRVIHGDLAARNVLLTEDRTAKITDFGLSRRLYDYSEYAKTQQEPLPWRWMSLESLRDLTFSTKSDVWSYGITLWEIFSLAQVPYPGYSWTMEFVTELENGLRMAKPQFASNELYKELMVECWHNDLELRPTFEQILEFLNSAIEKIALI